MTQQVICNVYKDETEIENAIQYYLNLYGTSAKLIWKITPKITGGTVADGQILIETEFMLTIVIFSVSNISIEKYDPPKQRMEE